MPLCTQLSDEEIDQPPPNAEIAALLNDVCRVTHEKWKVVGREIKWGRIFKKSRTVYSLYCYVGGFCPWQQILFYRDKDSDMSERLYVTLEHVAAFLLGLLNSRPAPVPKPVKVEDEFPFDYGFEDWHKVAFYHKKQVYPFIELVKGDIRLLNAASALVKAARDVDSVMPEHLYAAIICLGSSDGEKPGCGSVMITKDEYQRQVASVDQKWTCPRCNGSAMYDEVTSQKFKQARETK